MTMRMLLVEVSGDNILRILWIYPHFLHPLLSKLRHETVAFLVIGKTVCIFRRKRD